MPSGTAYYHVIQKGSKMENFSVIYRNFGHWDIVSKQGRLFRIRGGPGKYHVIDERGNHPAAATPFKTMGMCMAYICDDLMFELIVAEGQKPTIIESWNV